MGQLYDFVVHATGGRLLETSDQALDSAADFQQGFRTYLPLYNDYTGSSLSLEIDIQRPYDELREIDFGRLSDVAERCARIGDDFEEALEDVNTQVGTVNGWSGDAANAFRGYIQQFQTAAQTIDEDLEAIATATAEAVPAAQQVISEYVGAIGDIDFSGFDSTGDIRFMIEVERMLKSAGDVINAVLDWLGDLIGVALPLPGGGGGLFGAVTGFVVDRFGDAVDFILDALGMSVDGFLEWIASKVREYLDASFKAPFETNLQLLNDAVDAARTGIQDTFQPVVSAATAVIETPFAALRVPPEDNPNQPPAADSTPAASGTALTPTTGTGPDAGTGPGPDAGTGSGPDPGAGSGPDPGAGSGPVSGTGGGTGTGAWTGVGGGTGGHPDGLPPGAAWIADPAQLPPGWTVDPETGELLPPGGQDLGVIGDGEPPAAGPSEITVQYGDVTITVEPDGTGDGVQITLTDVDGDSTRYMIEVGEDGVPELVPAHGAGEADGVHDAGEPMEAYGRHGAGHTVLEGPAVAEPTGEPVHPAAFGPPAEGQPAVQHSAAGVQTAMGAVPASSNGAAFPAYEPPADAPAATVAAAVGFAGTADPLSGGISGSPGPLSGGISGDDAGPLSGGVSGDPAGQLSGGISGDPAGSLSGEVSGGSPSPLSGDVSGGGPGFASTGYSDFGRVASGSISSGLGDTPGPGAAQLASAADASAPADAQLASAGDDARAGQHGGTATPMMPMAGGTISGGDDERRGAPWQMPGDILEPEEPASRVSGVLGEDR